MAIFAVFGSSDPDKLNASITSKFSESYSVGYGQWLVSESSATTQEISEKIGDKGETGSFIVIPVNNYWGRHSANTWEWIQGRGI